MQITALVTVKWAGNDEKEDEDEDKDEDKDKVEDEKEEGDEEDDKTLKTKVVVIAFNEAMLYKLNKIHYLRLMDLTKNFIRETSKIYDDLTLKGGKVRLLPRSSNSSK